MKNLNPDKAIKDIFQTRLEDLIAESGKSVYELAATLGMSTGSLSSYQNGKAEPGITKLKRIADYFNVTCDYLLDEKEIKTHENTDIKNVTGFSEHAIENLKKLNEYEKIYAGNPEFKAISTINLMLESDPFMLLDIALYLYGFDGAIYEARKVKREITTNGVKEVISLGGFEKFYDEIKPDVHEANSEDMAKLYLLKILERFLSLRSEIQKGRVTNGNS